MTEKTFEEIRNEAVKILDHDTFIEYLKDLNNNCETYYEERINKILNHIMQQVREATSEEFCQALLGVNLPAETVKKIGKIVTTTDRITIKD